MGERGIGNDGIMGERLIGGMTRQHDGEGNCGSKGIVSTIGYGREGGIVGEAKHVVKTGIMVAVGCCGRNSVLWGWQVIVERQGVIGERGIVGEDRDSLLLEQNERNHVECT